MPVASNPLLQPTSPSQASAASSLLSSKAQDVAPSAAGSFASVYAKQSQADSIQKSDAAQAYADKLANANANKPSFNTQPDPAKPVVADSGNDLPAKAKVSANDSDKVSSKDDGKQKVDGNDAKGGTAKADDASKSGKADKADAKDAASDDTAAVADPAPADAKADPLLATTPVDPTATAAATPAADPALLAMLPPAAPPLATLPKADDGKGDDADGDFDPSADPLADLPAVRLALEQNAKAQGTTSAHAADPNQPTSGAKQGDDQNAVGSLTALIQQQVATDGKAASGGDKGLGASAGAETIAGAKGAAGNEASASGFADKLSALTQATAKPVSTAAATPPASPLQMNQSGWTEGVVNRVMYLSSQNLKSADIQLSPAELGRLDIKVSMTADQQTQVTFLSAHVGVREALEGQQSKLKEMFQQQGLGQMDVNVSDQPRQQNNGDAQAQQASRSGSGRAGGRNGSGSDDDSVGEVAAAVASPSLLGTSAIDYYA
jgi:flagellar hook-length control protein FliK